MSYKSGGNWCRGAQGFIFRNRLAVMPISVLRKKMMSQHVPSKLCGPVCRRTLKRVRKGNRMRWKAVGVGHGTLIGM